MYSQKSSVEIQIWMNINWEFVRYKWCGRHCTQLLRKYLVRKRTKSNYSCKLKFFYTTEYLCCFKVKLLKVILDITGLGIKTNESVKDNFRPNTEHNPALVLTMLLQFIDESFVEAEDFILCSLKKNSSYSNYWCEES